ncbi:hypothetical protein TNCV_4712101 [Trichonephila clavipes]|nr:hypothetical protein TNCV_4712101 [Trichonephila clavipes]
MIFTPTTALGRADPSRYSTSALQALSNYNENNCLRVQNCRELLGKIKGKIVFQWVPSHCGLWGNERADFLAKKGTGILQNFRRDLTLHSAKLEIKRIFRESFRLTASGVARDKPWSTLLTSPICVLCDTGQDMTAAHLDECSALNDLNCILFKGFFSDGSRNFEPWSSEEDDTPKLAHSPNFHISPTGGCLSLNIFNMHQPPRHGRSSAVLGLSS